MNAEGLDLGASGQLSPVLSTLANRARRANAIARAPSRKVGELMAAAVAAAPTRARIASPGLESAAMPKATVQPGIRVRGGARLTQAQLEARAQQREEDDELIRAAQRGERAAFDSLVRRYDQAVLRLALHMLGNEQDA